MQTVSKPLAASLLRWFQRTPVHTFVFCPLIVRAAQVLDAMVETGAIDTKTAAETKAAPAEVKAVPELAPATSWFADWIAKHEFPKVAGADTRTMKVRTTLVPELHFFPFRAAATPDGPQCDVEACADAYDSFRASDCTYQPYWGSRKVCSITDGSVAQVPSNPSCNVDVCSRRYRSFDPRTAAINHMAVGRAASAMQTVENSPGGGPETAN